MKTDKLVDFARKQLIKCDGRNHHVSLLVVRNKILSVGTNNYLKTSPMAKFHGYSWARVHSELDCIKRFPWRENDITRATLINLRFAKATDGLLMSRPCNNCINLIGAFGIKEVVFSTPEGFKSL